MGAYPDPPDDTRCRKRSRSACRCHPRYRCDNEGTHWTIWDGWSEGETMFWPLALQELGISWVCDGPHVFQAD